MCIPRDFDEDAPSRAPGLSGNRQHWLAKEQAGEATRSELCEGLPWHDKDVNIIAKSAQNADKMTRLPSASVPRQRKIGPCDPEDATRQTRLTVSNE